MPLVPFLCYHTANNQGEGVADWLPGCLCYTQRSPKVTDLYLSRSEGGICGDEARDGVLRDCQHHPCSSDCRRFRNTKLPPRLDTVEEQYHSGPTRYERQGYWSQVDMMHHDERPVASAKGCLEPPEREPQFIA